MQLWISSKMLCHAWEQKELLETRKDELRESILKSPWKKAIQKCDERSLLQGDIWEPRTTLQHLGANRRASFL